MKKKFSLSTSWPIYVTSIVVTSLIVSFGVSIKCRPTEEESIYVFAACESNNVSDFINESKKACDESIREMKLIQNDPSDKAIYTLFSGYYDITDFYILPYSWLTKINTICAHFTSEYLYSLIPNANGLYCESDDNGMYAFKIYDCNEKAGYLTKYFNYQEENYYILFRENSPHISGLNESASSNALNIVNYLLTL